MNNHYTKSSIEWSQYSMVKITQKQVGWSHEGAIVCQAGYHPRKKTFKTHCKHVFFRYENRPYNVFYVFACVFFLNLSAMSFPKFVNMTKNTPFFPILHVFALLNDVREYIAWSWKTTPITWFFFFFYEDDNQLQIQLYTSGPPGGKLRKYGHASRVTKCPYPDHGLTILI